MSVADVPRTAPAMRPAPVVRPAPAMRQALLRSALAAAMRGWPVFPCAPGGKRPALRRNWQDLATTDPDQIRDWWARAP
ncbi:MAG: bifunctional DNA primase/polymerase, partial [Trebonia sp.]